MSAETKTIDSSASEPSALRLILTLTIAGLISGIAIVSIYQATLPTITANKAKELREAVFKVLPSVTQLQKLAYEDGNLHVSTEAKDTAPVVYGGYDPQGIFQGYAIPAEGSGFQDTIRILYGYKPSQNNIVGMEVLESRETPGLGDKIYKDKDFHHNFLKLAVEPEIITIKKGAKRASNEVEAITGATISSRALVNILNTSMRQWLPRFLQSGGEPPLELPATDE